MSAPMFQTLAEFLLARITKDEAIGRELVNNGHGNSQRDRNERALGVHVLAEVDAKRLAVQMHAECGSGAGYCDDGGHGWDHVAGGGCADLAYLALPYAQAADYREEWRP